ncbi:MAG: hypothetical protein IT326_05020 [Anaerolineae bacterium]|nr:hypothetical protein [Anaerolineae bacterium]
MAGTPLIRRLALVLGLALVLSGCAAPGPASLQASSPDASPTVIVLTEAGPYFDRFNDAGNWLIGTASDSAGRVEEGRYILSIVKPSTLAWVNQQRAFGEGVYEMEATRLSGPEASAYGLLLMSSVDMKSFYYCMITGDGRYDVGLCQDGCARQESLIGGFKPGYTILTDDGATNRLRVEVGQTQITFIVNGAPISQIDNLQTRVGLAGFIGESAPAGGFEVAFDNLSVETSP